MLEEGAFVLHRRVDVFGTGFNALFFIASFGVLEGLRVRQKSTLPWSRISCLGGSLSCVHGVMIR